jgi:hypothetical protein
MTTDYKADRAPESPEARRARVHRYWTRMAEEGSPSYGRDSSRDRQGARSLEPSGRFEPRRWVDMSKRI